MLWRSLRRFEGGRRYGAWKAVSDGSGLSVAPTAGSSALNEARLRRLEAESALRLAEAEATRTRAEADAISVRTRAEADATSTRTRAEADATSTRTRAEAETASVRLSTSIRASLALACVGVCCALGVDWYLHESADEARRQVTARLRRGGVPNSARAPPNHLLPLAQSQLSLGFQPVMLMSPTGAGKSTLLASFARREAEPETTAEPALVVLLRLRAPPSAEAGGRGSQSATVGTGSSAVKDETLERLGATAAQVYNQIGFPLRRAVLRDVLDAVSAIRFGDAALDLRTCRERDRLVGALRTLFEACELLFHERVNAGMSRSDAAPILLLDEVHDLIRDDRLAAAGGRYLFQELATLLVAYVVDRQVVRAAVAGSSALLSVEFDRTVAAGARWEYFTLQDPAERSVHDALLAVGYSAADASDMMTLCGARMRLLRKPLRLGPSELGAAEFCAAARQLAAAHFADLFRAASIADARLFADTLDAAMRSERVRGRGRGPRPPALSRSFTEAHAEAASRVLYVQLDRTLAFQSRLHACVWREVRTQYR